MGEPGDETYRQQLADRRRKTADEAARRSNATTQLNSGRERLVSALRSTHAALIASSLAPVLVFGPYESRNMRGQYIPSDQRGKWFPKSVDEEWWEEDYAPASIHCWGFDVSRYSESSLRLSALQLEGVHSTTRHFPMSLAITADGRLGYLSSVSSNRHEPGHMYSRDVILRAHHGETVASGHAFRETNLEPWTQWTSLRGGTYADGWTVGPDGSVYKVAIHTGTDGFEMFTDVMRSLSIIRAFAQEPGSLSLSEHSAQYVLWP